ncbi:MAG TPA: aldehyde dehydrogenase (NADP(+)) [Jatrophihabitans sp.]|jgi:NADP-dependent aldehyde dehydrogenase
MTRVADANKIWSFDPRTGEAVGTPVDATPAEDVSAAGSAASAAAPIWARTSREVRARTLVAVADALDAASAELVELAVLETGLSPERLRGEVARTSGQLRLFADVACDGGYVDAMITAADPGASVPDVRRMLRPIGPVAVFSASNFPFAFSVAGGDTASALAAGCSVIVKGHEGHPQTSRRTAELVSAALAESGAPAGVFTLVQGREAGRELVLNPDVRAVGFTGSTAGGRTLFDLTSGRPDPIPFYGELGSVNPVVVLPQAAATKTAAIAEGYVASLTLGAGQFCTNPGLLFIPEGTDLLASISIALGATVAGPMLTERIFNGFRASTATSNWTQLPLLARGSANGAWAVQPEVRHATLAQFAEDTDTLAEERFGPAGLVVSYGNLDELLPVLRKLPGSLTASIHAADTEVADARPLTDALEPLVGRLIMNGWPTGVAVCWAMHHGGPWPASTAAQHTSVGATAIRRWLTPVVYQDWPEALLPAELRDDNPLNISQSRH